MKFLALFLVLLSQSSLALDFEKPAKLLGSRVYYTSVVVEKMQNRYQAPLAGQFGFKVKDPIALLSGQHVYLLPSLRCILRPTSRGNQFIPAGDVLFITGSEYSKVLHVAQGNDFFPQEFWVNSSKTGKQYYIACRKDIADHSEMTIRDLVQAISPDWTLVKSK
jgi:hypothetical protein